MASVILPDQLFPDPVDGDRKYLVEHPRYFTRFDFHKKKLVLHRASMKAYADRLDVEYLEFEEGVERAFREEDVIKMYEPVDHGLRRQFRDLASDHGVELEFEPTPAFVASREFNEEFFSDREYFQLDYYREMRRRHGVLVDAEGDPVGGKWSFDPENRERMPEEVEPPGPPRFGSEYVEEAKEYVEENFPDNPGSLEGFFWPVTREQALESLDDFLENRLQKFGDYQDALDGDLEFGFHSLLSAPLNVGLLTPREVLDRTLEAHEQNDYPMNSLEGFVRQVLGWREYIRALYDLEPGMRDRNFWNAENELPDEFYTGGTGLPPLDTAIDHAREHAYCHHIERLMVLGNVMLLLEVDPDEVYRWFMEMFIDSYDWVMVPNVYGMSQYAYPGMMTKPYISSSNYIREMSNYSGGEWEELWDGLYWSFVESHRGEIEDIQRMSFIPSHLDRMDGETLEEHRENAERFRQRLGMER